MDIGSKISELFQAQEIDIARNQSKMFARVLPVADLADYPNESYEVDLSQPIFEWKIDGSPVTWGPCQVIGSWAPDSTWIWGWENKSISASGYEKIKSAIQALDEINELSIMRKLSMSNDDAHKLAAWCAWKTGWQGSYPRHTENGGTVFLGLKLTAMPHHSVEPKDNPWCFLCGLYPSQVPKIIDIGNAQGLCSKCVERAQEVAKVSSLMDRRESQSQITCCLCRDKVAGIAFPHISICLSCIEYANKALQ